MPINTTTTTVHEFEAESFEALQLRLALRVVGHPCFVIFAVRTCRPSGHPALGLHSMLPNFPNQPPRRCSYCMHHRHPRNRQPDRSRSGSTNRLLPPGHTLETAPHARRRGSIYRSTGVRGWFERNRPHRAHRRTTSRQSPYHTSSCNKTTSQLPKTRSTTSKATEVILERYSRLLRASTRGRFFRTNVSKASSDPNSSRIDFSTKARSAGLKHLAFRVWGLGFGA